MRILHTADWHAGRSLNRTSLEPGLEKSLQDLINYAIREKVDAVLVAGDVFDQNRPPTDSQKLVYETLLKLSLEKIPVAVIAGNHDSVGHWHAIKPIFELANVTIAAQLHTQSVTTLQTKSGPLHLGLLPWPNERLLSPIEFQGGDVDHLKMSWANRVGKLVQVLCKGLPPGAPRVLMGHLMINGSRISSSQRTLSISDTYALAGEIFPNDLNYVALGHIHEPQTVSATVKCCYSGSLRPMDFGEAGHRRGFYRVEVGLGKPTETEFVELTPAQPLYQLDIPRASMEIELKERANKPGLYKVVVQLTSPEPGLADTVRQILPDAIIVKGVLLSHTERTDELKPETLLKPLETFRQYHLTKYASAPEPELEELFLSLIKEESNEAT